MAWPSAYIGGDGTPGPSAISIRGSCFAKRLELFSPPAYPRNSKQIASVESSPEGRRNILREITMIGATGQSSAQLRHRFISLAAFDQSSAQEEWTLSLHATNAVCHSARTMEDM